MDYADPAQIEAFLLQRIREKTEKEKLDLKRDLTGWDNKTDKDAQMNFIRLVSAFVNTSADEFDDYGFLVYGADKSDGDITSDVSILRTKGSDKLHAEMGQQLARYLFPVPRFEIYDFQREEKTWGAVVIEPMAQGPSIFIRESTGWRVGEWRVRRGARTEMPTADDYRRMQQGWTTPLEREIRRLERAIAGARGELQARAKTATPSLEIGPSKVSLQIKDPEAIAASNWTTISAYYQLQELVARIHTSPRTQKVIDEQSQKEKASLKVLEESIPEAVSFSKLMRLRSSSLGLLGPQIFNVSEARLDKVFKGLEEANISVQKEDYKFPSLTVLRGAHEILGDTWGGEDLERFKWFCDIEEQLPKWRFHRNEAAKLANCLNIPIKLKNNGLIAIDDLTVEVSVDQGNFLTLLEYLPSHGEYQSPKDASTPSWMKHLTIDRQISGPAHVIISTLWKEDIKSLRPSDEAKLQIPVEIVKAGTVKLQVRVKGRNLPEPVLHTIQVKVQP